MEYRIELIVVDVVHRSFDLHLDEHVDQLVVLHPQNIQINSTNHSLSPRSNSLLRSSDGARKKVRSSRSSISIAVVTGGTGNGSPKRSSIISNVGGGSYEKEES